MSRLTTLRARFALWTAGLLLTALTLFGGFVYANMSRSLVAAVDNGLRLTAAQLVAGVDVRNGQLASIDTYLEDSQQDSLRAQGFSLRVLNLAGQPVQGYGPYQTLPAPSTAAQPEFLATVTDAATGHPVRVFTTPIVENERPLGTLQVAQDLTAMQRTLTQLLTSLLIGVPLMVVIAGVGGYILAARTLTPIDQITLTAQRISAEDLSARLNLPATVDEVGRLAATFDSMLARLDEAFHRERQFVADASHELRTPLAAIQTMLGSTLVRRRTPVEYEQVLADVGGETERLRTLVEGLLHLSRGDAARGNVFEMVNLSQLLRDVTDSLRPLAEEKGLALTTTISNGLTLTGDSDSLIRLFVNLVGNAIKYTAVGQIVVTAEPLAGRGIRITVADTGCGIPAEHLPRIFDRFYRVDPARSAGGTGLGLAMVRQAAQAHAGIISADSVVGQGSTFTVTLPA